EIHSKVTLNSLLAATAPARTVCQNKWWEPFGTMPIVGRDPPHAVISAAMHTTARTSGQSMGCRRTNGARTFPLTRLTLLRYPNSRAGARVTRYPRPQHFGMNDLARLYTRFITVTNGRIQPFV